MQEPVRCGVIGLGLMGSVHASILAKLARADLAVCCDLDPSASERCPEGTRFTTEVNDLFSEPGLEAVFICTPEHAHRKPVEEALSRGLHVFCEKPIAGTLEDADAMIAAEKEAGLRLVIGHCLRFDPRYAIVRERVRSGELGQTIHTNTRRSSSYAEGRHLVGRTSLPLYLSVHDFDVAQWILNAEISRVFAEAASITMADAGGVDTVVATLRFTDGSVALHETSWALPDQAGLAFGDYYFSFIGSKGCAFIEIRDQNLMIFGGGDAVPVSDDAPAWTSGARGSFEYPETTYMPEVGGIPFGIYMAELEHFLAGIRDGRPPAITTTEARSALAGALALDQSLASGLPIDLPSSGSA